MKEILNDMREPASDNNFSRIHLLNNKDLYNIKKEFNINYSPILENDHSASTLQAFEVTYNLLEPVPEGRFEIVYEDAISTKDEFSFEHSTEVKEDDIKSQCELISELSDRVSLSDERKEVIVGHLNAVIDELYQQLVPTSQHIEPQIGILRKARRNVGSTNQSRSQVKVKVEPSNDNNNGAVEYIHSDFDHIYAKNFT